MMVRSSAFPLLAVLSIVLLAPNLVNGAECPIFPKQLSLNCAPHSPVDECKFDADCTQSNNHKCCLIGCQKMCLNPSLIEGASVCPVLPRPSPCPNEPNECSDESDCSVGRKCCSDGCRMVCAEQVVVPTTATPKTTRKSCNVSVDVAFIIDSSGSIGRRNYEKIKTFVKEIARSFAISPSGSQLGIILYSTKASIKAHFSQYTTTEEFVKAVGSLPYERGLTYINLALKLAASQLFPRARKNVPKIAMLLTDGKQTNPTGTINLREASAPLRNQGVRIITFGVGKNINLGELRLTVERDEDVIPVLQFDDLITKVREYTASLCQAAETEPIHPDADIIFLIDSSIGVSSQQFDMEKQFVRRMASYFIVSPLGPRAAFVSYATTSHTVIGFSGYSSTADFSRQINNAPFLDGRRRIDQALIHAAKMFRETGRVGLRIVILLTAGNYYMGPGARSILSVMSPLHSLDAHMYVIGIGPYFTTSMFTPMVRGPSDIFDVPSFQDLTPWQARIARHLRLSTNAFKYEPAYWRADVIFLMDSSRYVTANNYNLEKNFVKLMARLLNLASNRSRAALYAFSDRPQLQITFDGYQARETFDAAVNKAPHLQANRRIDKAFHSAAELIRTKSRASVPKYVILLTTGKQTLQSDTRSLADASRYVRSYGGRVFVVAILTGGYTISEFYPAVQRPQDAFSVSSFTDLLPRAPAMAARIMASWRAPANSSFSADIAFIMDSSSTVSPFQYTRAKRFVRILSEYLNVAPGQSRGALVTFGENPVEVFGFDSYRSLSEFRTQVTEAPYLGGELSISSTFSAVGTLFSDARGSYPWIAILVTPWRPDYIQDRRRLEILARPLLSRGVWLYVLSIGENPYVGWLSPMLVEPRDAFSILSYRDLPGNIGPVASYITNDNYLYGHSSFQVDILFLMDTSTGVDLQDYKIEKGFVQRIALHLGIFTGRSRAALVAYGANSLVVFGFGGYDSNSEFVRRINDAPMFGGNRRVDRALDTAAALMLGARSTMPKVVVLIMAGKQSSASDAIPIKDAVSPLRQLGAWLYIMAIGQSDPSELQKATLRSTDIFFARSFSGLLGYIAPMASYIANTSVITGTSLLNADIVFAVDCSSSVPFREYSTEKSFVRSLAQYLNIQPGQSRAALTVYGSRVFTVIRLERSQSLLRFDSVLTRAPYLGGLRRYDKALDIARGIFANARENVPKVMLLFIAGRQAQATGAKSLQDAVKPLQQRGVITFIFRIGSEPGIGELVSAVDRPGNVFTFSSFPDMGASVPYVARHIPFYSALLGPSSFATDVVYLIDSSDPVTQDQYGDQKEFVTYLARYLNMMPSRTRGAVITYGSTAVVVINLGVANTSQAFYKAVNNAAKVGGERRMDRAIDAARDLFDNARPAIPKVVILLTTGNQPAGIQARVLGTAFQRLYDLGARLYAVTINAPTINLPLKSKDGSDWFPVRTYLDLPIQVLPLARHVASDTASLGPYDFVADIIFMLDSSSHVTPEDYFKEKEFVKLIARYLNITPGKSRGSVIIFSADATPILPFSGYTTMSEFNAVIDRASQLTGKRRIDRAFGVAATLFENARPNVLKIAIVLTGGMQSPDGGSLQEAMRPLRNMDVVTYVIAVGAPSDVPVERPEDIFILPSYNDLPREVQRIARNISNRKEPTAATTTTAPRVTTQAPTTPDPCKTPGCTAPYNVGCRVVNNRARCVCLQCPVIRRPVCASDDVQDLSECLMKKQACEGDFNVTVAKQGPCDRTCRAVVDIAFIIDSSGSIGRENWQRMKRFVKSIVSRLDVSSSTTRIAAIAYSTNPAVVMFFRNFQGTDMVNRLVDNTRWQRGLTYTDKALLLAESSLFQTSNGMRLNVPKLAVVITDGRQTTTGQYTKLSVASQGIKNKGVAVYAVGVGTGTERAELEEIASRPEYVFTASSFEELKSISSGLTRRLCEEAIPISTTTSTPTPKQTTLAPTTPDPCKIKGCSAPYNIGCRVVNNKAQCICPTCRDFRRPVCASDGVQDLTECHLKQQACWADMNITVAKEGPCDKACSDVLDIAFIIDSSGSIGRTNWERTKRFVKSVISRLDVSSSTTHIAAIAYSTNPEIVWRFIDFQGRDMLNRVLDRMTWQRGYTYTDKALLLADRALYQTSNGMRLNVSKFAVVITDGKQTTRGQYTKLSVASRGMKNKGVTVYVVGVGSGADKTELEEIASGPEFVLTSSSFENLQNSSLLVLRGLCEVPTTKETPTPTPKVTTKQATPTFPDPCQTHGCTAPYNIGCQVVDNKAQCICPTCPRVRRPVCASDDVQDLTECHLKQQSCLADMNVTVAKQGSCDKECSRVLDIAFIIDSSGSIGRTNWERMKRFVKSVVSKLDVSSSAARVAAIAYSTNPSAAILFRYYQGTDEVNRLLDRMRWQRGYTYTDKALLLANSRLFQTSNGMREGARKLAIVITDGKQTTTGQYTRLSVASQGMKNKGVTVYAVGVGSGANKTELEEIASGPEYVLMSKSFTDLQNISEVVRRRLCDEATPTPWEIRTTIPTTSEPTTTMTTPKLTQTITGPKVTTPPPTTADPCKTEGCNAPYNIGCRVVNNRAECVCPSCSNIRRPVCASDGVQDLSECHLRQQACLADVLVTVAKPSPCDKECRPELDIAFIIDSSGSIGRWNWERMKRFIKSIVSKLDVGSSAARVAAIAYSTNPEVVMLFRNFQRIDEVNRLLDRMRWQRGLTYTDKALLLADSRVFQTVNGMRMGVRKLAIVITDGKQTTTGQYTSLSVASRRIKSKGVTVYAVGVGSGADKTELEEIASGPEYVFKSSSFTDLQNISEVVRSLLCDQTTPTPREIPTTTPKQTPAPTTSEPTTTQTTPKVTQTTTAARVTTPAPTTADPCTTEGCNAPYNTGCRVVNNRAQCICPSCSNIRRPVCASDGVQDLSECHLRQQACLADITVTVARERPCHKECRSIVDIALIIDSSESIGRRNWVRMKRFVKSVVSKLDVSSSATHVAVIAYSTNPVVEMRFWNAQSTDDVNQLIDQIPWQRGLTYTDKALELADRDIFTIANGMRINVPKLAVVITDGKQTKRGLYTRLSVASRGIKNKGVTVYAVGVGSGADKTELEEIASGPTNVFTSLSFKDLRSIPLGLTRQICAALPTPTTKGTPSLTPKLTTPIPTTSDPCKTVGCTSPYNIGCRVVDNQAECICPTCPSTRNPVCASDGVQDSSECYLRRQACLGNITVMVATQGPCARECFSVVDIAFIMDSSGSIGRGNWEKLKRFVKSIVSRFDVGSSATHVALIAYSTNPIVEMRFWNTQTTDDVNQLIDQIPWQRGLTYTDKALQIADRDIFTIANGMRPEVPKLAVVITDGKQTSTGRLFVASQGIKSKGVTVFAVGIGSGVDQKELKEIASESKNVYAPQSFKDLQGLSPKTANSLCDAVPSSSTPSLIPTTILEVTPTPTNPDPCQITGCTALYSIGCRVVQNKAQCICPSCPNVTNPVCASDDVQDLSECHMNQQACQGHITAFVEKEGPCDKECRSLVDIAFIIDSSESVGRRNWEKVKRFLKSVVSKLDVSSSATHVAAIAYSTEPEVLMRFSDEQDTDQVNRAFDKMHWQRGFTRTDEALLLADKDLFQTSKGMRPSVAKMAIVITDGKQTTTGGYTRLSKASEGIKNKDVTVYAVGVGRNVDEDELNEIATSPDYVWTSSSFTVLQAIAPQIRKAVCEDPKVKYSADVLFIMDSSSDTTSTYNAGKDLVKRLARYLNINPEGVRAALAVFSGRPQMITDFESFRSTSDFESAVDRAPHTGGNRSVSDALRSAGKMFNSPSSVSKVIFLVMSGKPLDEEDGSLVGDVVDKLSSLGVRTYVALVGEIHNIGNFRSMVEDPENVFAIDSQGDISNQVNRVGTHVMTDSVTPKETNLTMYVLFILDSSAEVSASNFTEEKELVKFLINQLNIDPASSGSRVGIMVYSNETEMILDFQNRENKTSLEEIVDNIPQLQGPRRIDSALKAAIIAFEDVDTDHPKFVVLLAAGQQTYEPGADSFSAAVRPLHHSGTKTYVMAIGDDVDPGYFQADDQEKTNVVSVPSFSDLPQSASRLARDLVTDYVSPKEPARPTGSTTKKATPSSTTAKETSTVPSVTTKPGTTPTAPPVEGIKVPHDYKVEVVYVLDSSSFVGPENYELEKEFTKAIARVLNHNPTYTQSAVITFGALPEMSIGMGSYRDLESFSEAVDNLRYLGGMSNLPFAVAFAARAFSTNGSKVPNIVIVITNKDPSSKESIDMLAGTLRREGKIVNVIGVGKEADFPNLRRLAGRSNDMFTPKSFDDLMSYVPKVASNIFSGAIPTSTISTRPSTASTTTSKVTTTGETTTPEKATTAESTTLSTQSTPVETTASPKPTPTTRSTTLTSRITPSSIKRGKPGSCPYIPRPSSCSSRLGQCNHDVDCRGDLKCCYNGCGRICVSTGYTPRTVGLQAGTCPLYSPNRQCSSSVQDGCTCHSDCDQDNSYKCCFDGCRRLCRKTIARIQCVRGVDIVFLMDSSESITEEDFQREKTAVKEIAGSFLNASLGSRAGVIMYSGQAELSVDFVGQNQFELFASAVDALAHRRSMTRIDRALRYASTTLFANPRPLVTSIAVVMTDGVQTPDPDLEPLGQAVAPLHSKGVRVLAVGVGPRVDRNELKELVKREEDMFQMSSFQDLLDKSAQLLDTVCPQPPRTLSTTPITTTKPPPTTTPTITTTTSTESDPTCDKLFDAIFVMDSSQSINAPQYAKQKEFVKELATIINVGAGSRAAVIIYSDRAQLRIQFDQHRNLDSFKLAVDALPYLQQRTRIDKALALTAQTLNQARAGFPKAVFIMTDGRQTQEPDAVPLDVAADAIRRQGAHLLVVGVGQKISESGLLEIAEDSSNLFVAQTFQNLEKATRDVVTAACNKSEIATMPETTTTPTPDTRSCPELTEPPSGFCTSNRSTCFGDESCSYGKCCYDGCRFTCTSVGGIGPLCAKAFDLGFAMDSSGSIRDANYQKEKDFIKGMADQLDIGLQTVQLGLIVFSDVPFLLIRFGTLKSTDRSSFATAVDNVPYFRGRTRIDSALETAANDLFPQGRQSSVPQVFLLITDGRQSQDPGAVALDQAVRPLQEKGIKVIVIGIGDDVDRDELKSLVENPNDDVFFVSSFDDLKGLLDDERLVDALCIPKRRRL